MNGDTLLAQLLHMALTQRDQLAEQLRQRDLRIKELEAAREDA